MNFKELMGRMRSQSALLVHCSRLGKGKVADSALFPNDLRTAIQIADEGQRDLSCSVIWPGNLKTFGEIGIVLRPRSMRSITSINPTDGGTQPDPITGRRTTGSGQVPSEELVTSTFNQTSDYNEWTVGDADCIGIYVSNLSGVNVAARSNKSDDSEIHDHYQFLTVQQIESEFPGLPVFNFQAGKLIQLGGSPYWECGDR